MSSAPVEHTKKDNRLMGDAGEGREIPPAYPVEMVVRVLRHEVGDLLQSVYSAAAILQDRLPAGQTMERRIVADLRSRAETCKNELDAAHDLVCPLSLNVSGVDLGELSRILVTTFSSRYQGLDIVSEAASPLQVWADGQKLTQAGTLLMLSLCQAAPSKVWVRALAQPSGEAVEWSFHRDGPPVNAEQLTWLNTPFGTTRHARLGLGLALARRVIELHGGQIAVGGVAETGFGIVFVVPRGQPSA